MERIVDISSEGMHLAVRRGFLVIEKDGDRVGQIALDDIGGVLTHAHGLTWSNNVFVRLAERDIPVVVSGANHMPIACVWPLEGHHRQSARMRAQLSAKVPLRKRIWKQIVSSKILMQGAVVQAAGGEAGAFDRLARSVRSGDPDNVEAQAARRYWPLLMGSDFRRDRNAQGMNGLLNYGYTVLRALVSRAICGSGLHPTLGVHHANQSNAFALADDLMEPYRPLVDQMALNLVKGGCEEVNSTTKRVLAELGTLDMDTAEGLSPVSVQIGRLTQSLAKTYLSGEVTLDLPSPPPALVLAQLGTEADG